MGDWDGDGTSNIGLRRGNTILLGPNNDGAAEMMQVYGNGTCPVGYPCWRSFQAPVRGATGA